MTLPPDLPPADRIDAVLFDLGGVLVQLFPERFLRRLGERAAGWTPDLRFFAEEAYHRFARGEIDPRGFHAAVEARLGVGWSFPEFARAWCDVFEEIPSSVDALRRLYRRRPLWVLSNTDPLHFEAIRRRWDWADRFDGRVLSYEVGAEKPDPVFFEAFLRASRLDPGRCLFFDDLGPNLAAARAAGIVAVDHADPGTSGRVVAALFGDAERTVRPAAADPPDRRGAR